MARLPDASFAGQQESFLNIRGELSLLIHVRKCFASLFSGSRYFCESLFWASQPKQAAKT
ncbi:PEP/pyruvate-binding domain-containing protein [Bathymodiolus japonicus methanotrophic gill symbiont]|uniref:PEP/pyruvate-binding domain-containing protein n=1 Tax=Bathymodiolus japonicus methanotrophic gill symbiont TaxID=113269 RepID=UPI001C8DAB5C